MCVSFLVLQQDVHSPSAEVHHVQVQRPRDAERDGGDEGAEDEPSQGLLQLQEGGRRHRHGNTLLGQHSAMWRVLLFSQSMKNMDREC